MTINLDNIEVVYTEKQLESAIRLAYSAGVTIAQDLPKHVLPEDLNSNQRDNMISLLLYTIDEIKRRFGNGEEL